MQVLRSTFFRAFFIVVATIGAAHAGEPNCGLSGVWNFTEFGGVGRTQGVTHCRLQIDEDGQYASFGNCALFMNGRVGHGASGGVLKADSKCILRGNMSALGHAPGLELATIGGGIVSGDHAVAVGFAGKASAPTEVRMIVLNREMARNDEVLAFTAAYWGKTSANCPNVDVTAKFLAACNGREMCVLPITTDTMADDHCSFVPKDATIFSYCKKHGKKVAGSQRTEIVPNEGIWDAACPRILLPDQHAARGSKSRHVR